MNGDGLQDVLIGSFSGVPQWIMNTKDGFGESTGVLDKDGAVVAISKYWDHKADDWNNASAGTGGLCTSVAAVDWDGDGDMDLLLGGYKDGTLFLRLNEGSAKDTKLATSNLPVMVGGKAVALQSGIGAPRVADWDGDGLFDILIGTIYGEVLLLHNIGSKGGPVFAEMTTLIAPLPGKAGSKKTKRVAAKDGAPVAPGSSFHIEVADYDGDGDLDLLVGGRSEWLTGPKKDPTAEDLKRARELTDEAAAVWNKLQDFQGTATTEEEAQAIVKTEKHRTFVARHRALRAEARALTADPIDRGDFVWLFRRN